MAFILVTLSGLVGYVAWLGDLHWLPMALALPVIWSLSTSRFPAWLIGFAYHGAASFGLVLGTAQYYGTSSLLGYGIWIGACLVQSIPYALLWSEKKKARAWRYLLVLSLLAIPPLGIVGWASPLTSSGVLFPGWGWIGLGITTVLAYLVCRWPIVVAFPLLVSLYYSDHSISYPTNPPNCQGTDTHFWFNSGDRDFMADYYRQLEMVQLANTSDSEVLVFAESLGGLWTDQTEDLWRSKLKKDAPLVLTGAEISLASGKSENVLMMVDRSGSEVVYRQRMPVPVSMWKPFSNDGYVAHWFDDSVIRIEGKKVAPLICYEQFLVWPVLHSMIGSPDLIVAVGNGWWAKGTRILDQQRVIVRAWARLFGVSVVFGVNG